MKIRIIVDDDLLNEEIVIHLSKKSKVGTAQVDHPEETVVQITEIINTPINPVNSIETGIDKDFMNSQY